MAAWDEGNRDTREGPFEDPDDRVAIRGWIIHVIYNILPQLTNSYLRGSLPREKKRDRVARTARAGPLSLK